MSDRDWYVPSYRNCLGTFYRAQRVKWADFAGVCMSLDRKVFWTRAAAERRAAKLNAAQQRKGEGGDHD